MATSAETDNHITKAHLLQPSQMQDNRSENSQTNVKQIWNLSRLHFTLTSKSLLAVFSVKNLLIKTVVKCSQLRISHKSRPQNTKSASQLPLPTSTSRYYSESLHLFESHTADTRPLQTTSSRHNS